MGSPFDWRYAAENGTPAVSQYGGPDGELGASLRYLSQRFSQTDKRGIALLTDIGTEELSHLEMIGSIVTQLNKGEGARSFDRYSVGDYYIDHANAVYPASAVSNGTRYDIDFK
mgnify:CR=1 FL=1